MESLRGQLLIASPGLIDPNFRRTVVLVGDHGEQGAMGVVLNRPSATTVEEAVPLLSEVVDAEEPVHVGGPVQQQAIVVLGEFDEPERAGVLVFGSVGFVPGEVDDAVDLGEMVRARVFAGYAGWGPGQLENELQEAAWIVAPAAPDDVFTADPDALWSMVLRRKGGLFAFIATIPPDPSLN
jgi:putative transcriptional regulator